MINLFESHVAIRDLVKKLPGLQKHDYDTIDRLMKEISSRHKISTKALHNLFKAQFNTTPDDWIKNKLDEEIIESDLDIQKEVNLCAEWAKKKLKINKLPKIELSQDTEEAQTNHHTGGHVLGSDKIWVYAKNRNLVDILRTVLHELTHVKQDELGMIKPGDSYPGSPIEAQADKAAGELIKIYGEENHHIFQ
jgi:hypothetical protein